MGIQARIENTIADLSPAMRRLADAILANPAIVLEQTISELAMSGRTSVASVVRFCRALGLTGYGQLRMALATELGREEAQFGSGLALGTQIAKADTLQDMATKIATLEMLAIEQTVSSLDYVALACVVDAIDKAQRILLFGVGASHFVAQDLHHKLFRIGRNAFVMADSHEAWSAALLAPPSTVAIGFSHSGTTPDTVRYLDIANAAGATTVAITGNGGSALAGIASETLIGQARESQLRAGAMVSRIAQLTIVDCLFMGVAQKRFDQSIEALQRTRDITHPASA